MVAMALAGSRWAKHCTVPVETSPPSIQPVNASTKVAWWSTGDSWIFKISLWFIVPAPTALINYTPQHQLTVQGRIGNGGGKFAPVQGLSSFLRSGTDRAPLRSNGRR